MAAKSLPVNSKIIEINFHSAMKGKNKTFVALIVKNLLNFVKWMPDRSTVCISLFNNVTVQAFGHDIAPPKWHFVKSVR